MNGPLPVGVYCGGAAELPEEDLEVRRQRAVDDEVGGAAMERCKVNRKID